MATRKKALFETPNRRIRKRRRLIRRMLILLVLIGILLTGIFFFFRVSEFHILEVTVSGAQKIDPAVIRQDADKLSEGNTAYFIPKRFFLAYPRKQIESYILEHHKEINVATVRLRGFSKAEIVIEERTPYAFYCTYTCFVADANGLAYEEASTTPTGVIFRDKRDEHQNGSLIGKYPLETSIFKEVESFARKLSDLKLHLKEIVIEENDDLSVETEEGTIIISSHESLTSQYEFLKVALSQKMFLYPDGAIRSFNYIDLRFGKKVFYRFDEAPMPTPAVPAPSSSATSTESSLDI